MNEQEFEQVLQDKGLTAPRLKPEDIDAAIVHSQYYVFPGTVHTVCCLTLVNGFTVTGENACVSRENWDEAVGRTEAYANAREKVWGLEAYLLKQRLAGSQA